MTKPTHSFRKGGSKNSHPFSLTASRSYKPNNKKIVEITHRIRASDRVPYGYWITDAGKLWPVSFQGHDKFLSDYDNASVNIAAHKAGVKKLGWYATKVLGWIRLVDNNHNTYGAMPRNTLDIDFCQGQVARAAYQELKQFLDKHYYDAYSYELQVPEMGKNGDYDQTTDPKRLLNLVYKNVKKSTLEADVKPTVMKNPSTKRILALIKNAQYNELKGLVWGKDVYIWNEVEEWHHHMQAEVLGLKRSDPGRNEYLNKYSFVIMPARGKKIGTYCLANMKVDNETLLSTPYLRNLVKEADLYLEDGKMDKLVKGVDYIKEHNIEASDRKLGRSIAEIKGKNDLGFITIYRAVDSRVSEFLDKDYVTLSLKFAKEHAEHNAAVQGEPQVVLKSIVETKYVYEAYNPGEYFYSGPIKRGKIVYKTGQELEAANDIPDKFSSYWITDTGKFIDAEFTSHKIAFLTYLTVEGNDKLLIAFNKKFGKRGVDLNPTQIRYDEVYEFATKQGWIRVAEGLVTAEIMVQKDCIAGRALSALVDYLQTYDQTIKNYSVEVIGGAAKTFVRFSEALALLRKNVKTNTLKADFDEYGYWITDKGEIQTVGHQEHELHIRKTFNDVVSNAYVHAYQKGWIRVLNERNVANIEFMFGNVTKGAIKGLTELVTKVNLYKGGYLLEIKKPRVDGKLVAVTLPEDLRQRWYTFEENQTRQMLTLARRCTDKEITAAVDDNAWWIKADGTVIPTNNHPKTVENYVKQDPTLLENFNSKRLKFSNAYDLYDYAFYKMNWLRMFTIEDKGNNLYLNFGTHSITKPVLNAVSKILKEEVFKSIHIEIKDISWDVKNIVFDGDTSTRHILEVLRQNVKREITAADEPYGYWINSEGELLEVPYQGHDSIAERYVVKRLYNEYFNFVMRTDSGNYNTFCLSQGWIRILNRGQELSVQFMEKSVAPQAARALSKYVKDHYFERIIQDISDREDFRTKPYKFDTESNSDMREFLVILRSNVVRPEITADDFNEPQYGFWFTDRGEKLDVDEMQHDRVAGRYINNDEEAHEKYMNTESEDYKEYVMKHLGWIRTAVTGDMLYVEVVKDTVAPEAYKSLIRFVNTEDTSQEYYFDASGKYKYTDKKSFLLNLVKEQVRRNILEAADAKKFVVKNPSPQTAQKMLDNARYKELRGLAIDNDLYIWDANLPWHHADQYELVTGTAKVTPEVLSKHRLFLEEHRLIDIRCYDFNDVKDNQAIQNLLKDPKFNPFSYKDHVEDDDEELTAAYHTSEPYFSAKALREANEEADSRKSRTTLIMMKPSEFLKMAKPGFSQTKYDGVRAIAKARQQFNSTPYLHFENNGDGTATVIGHEGRHRAMVLEELGDKPMPVRFNSLGGKGGSIRWGSQDDSHDKIDVWPEKLIGQGNNSHHVLPFPDSEYYPRNKKLEAAYDFSTKRCFITDKGKIIDVHYDHYKAAMDFLSESKERLNTYTAWTKKTKIVNGEYYLLKEFGWIRVADSNSYEIAENSVSKKAYQTLLKMVNTSSDNYYNTSNIYYLDITSPSDKDFKGSKTEIFKIISNNVRTTEKKLEAADGEESETYGYWITERGKLLRCSDNRTENYGHAYTLRRYLKDNPNYYQMTDVDKKLLEGDYYWFIMKKGWIRIVIEDMGHISAEFIKGKVSKEASLRYRTLISKMKSKEYLLDIATVKNSKTNEFKIKDFTCTKAEAIKLIKENTRTNTMEAMGDGEAYWISDEGKVIKVHYTHFSTAEDYINANLQYKEEFKNGDNPELFMLKKGWVRVAADDNISLEIGANCLSRAALSTINKGLKPSPLGNIHIDVTSSITMQKFNIFKADRAGIAKAYRLLRANLQSNQLTALDESDDPFEAWITDKAIIPSTHSHMRTLKKIIADNKKEYGGDLLKKFVPRGEFNSNQAAYDYGMRQLGFIRVIGSPRAPSLMIAKGCVDPTAYRLLNKYLRDRLNPRELVFLDIVSYLDDDSNFGSTPEFIQNLNVMRVLKEVKNNVKNNTLEASETHPYGYWITAKGELLEVPKSDAGHPAAFKQYADNNTTDLDDQEQREVIQYNNNWPLLKRGWIRLVEGYPDGQYHVNIGLNSVSSKACSKLTTFLPRIQDRIIVEVTKDDDLNGQSYSITTKHDVIKLVKENTNKTIEAADKFNSDAWWITEEGKIIDVGDNEHAYLVAPERISSTSVHDIVKEKLYEGWIRVRKDSNHMYVNFWDNKLCKKSIDSCKKLLQEQEGDEINYEIYRSNKDDDYYELPYSKIGISKLINIMRSNTKIKTIVAIDGANNIEWTANETILSTWRTGNKDQRIELVKSNNNYVVRSFNPDGSLDNEEAYKFQETAAEYLLKTVIQHQNNNIFYNKETNMDAIMQAADDEKVFERWETPDGRFAMVFGQEGKTFVIKDYVKNQLSQNWHGAGTSYLGNKTRLEAGKEFTDRLDRMNQGGANYQKVDGSKQFSTPVEQRKNEAAQVTVRGKAGAERVVNDFKLFTKPTLPGLEVLSKKVGSNVYVKVRHKASGLDLISTERMNKPLQFSLTEFVERLNDFPEFKKIDWTLDKDSLFNKYDGKMLLQDVRKFLISLESERQDDTDRELDAGLKRWVKDYLIARYLARPNSAKNLKRQIDETIKKNNLNADKVYNYYGNPDDRTREGRDKVLKNIGMERTAKGYDFIKEIPVKPKVVDQPPLKKNTKEDEITQRIERQKAARNAANSEEVNRPARTGVANSMLGDYVEGVLKDGTKIQGVVLTQKYDKKRGASSGSVVTLIPDDDNDTSYKILTIDNMKRLLVKPPKKLISTYNILSAKRRLEAALSPEQKKQLAKNGALNRQNTQPHIKHTTRFKIGDYVQGQYKGYKDKIITIKGIVVKENSAKNNGIASGGILFLGDPDESGNRMYGVREATHIERIFERVPAKLREQFEKIKTRLPK